MKFGIFGILLLSAQIVFAQIFTIETVHKNDNQYAFPLIHSSQRPGIAEKMNLTIQKNLDSESDPRDPFANVSGEDEYSFVTGAVNERLLHLVVIGSHSGMGSHDSRTIYNFDSRTGETIDLDKLFGTDGQVKLRKTLCKLWKEVLKANLDTEPWAEEYKACMADAKTTIEVDVFETWIGEQSITFMAGGCLDGSNHEQDRSTGPYTLSFGQLLPMLTPYGYSLFVDKASASPFQTLLRGTIDGKYPISLTLSVKDNALGGIIVYDRVGQPLNLGGTMEGQRMILHELDESKNPLSDIAVTWSGTQLSGTFINLKSKIQMPFVVSPVLK